MCFAPQDSQFTPSILYVAKKSPSVCSTMDHPLQPGYSNHRNPVAEAEDISETLMDI